MTTPETILYAHATQLARSDRGRRALTLLDTIHVDTDIIGLDATNKACFMALITAYLHENPGTTIEVIRHALDEAN